MVKKIFNTFIVALMLALSLFLAAAVTAGNFAYAEDKPALSVEDDFDKTEGKLDENLNAYAYGGDLARSTDQPNYDYGLIPAKSWGREVEVGTGYLVYHLKADSDSVLDNIVFEFEAYYGCCGVAEYYGKCNIVVEVSKDGENYSKAFDLKNGSAYSDILKCVVTRTPNVGVEIGQENLYGHQSCTMKYTASLSSVMPQTKQVFVKISLEHITYDALYEATMGGKGKTPEQHYTSENFKDEARTVALNRVGIRLHNAKLTASQAEFDDSDLTSYGKSMFIDYGDEKYLNDYKNTAYEMNGLTVVDGVKGDISYTVNGNMFKTNALCPSLTNSEGYAVYKFVAEGEGRFKGATAKTVCRLFDYSLKLEHEKVDYYVSFDNIDYELVYSSRLTKQGGNCPEMKIELDKYVYGAKTFYFKIVIGCSANRGWTNLKEFGMDLEYDTVTTTVVFGGGKTQEIQTPYGSAFDKSLINYPENFYRTDNNLYSDEAFTAVVEDSALLYSDRTVYAAGEWDRYSVTYVLNGGTNAAGNAEFFYSDKGMTIAAPEREGYSFCGWYYDAEFKQAFFGDLRGVTENVTLYAKWAVNTAPEVPESKTEGSGCGSAINGVFPWYALGLAILPLLRKLKRAKR